MRCLDKQRMHHAASQGTEFPAWMHAQANSSCQGTADSDLEEPQPCRSRIHQRGHNRKCREQSSSCAEATVAGYCTCTTCTAVALATAAGIIPSNLRYMPVGAHAADGGETGVCSGQWRTFLTARPDVHLAKARVPLKCPQNVIYMDQRHRYPTEML